jgi:transmembrane sensor
VTPSREPDPGQPDAGALDALGWELLARYFADAADADDLDRLKQWLGADVGRHRELERLRGIWAVAAESSVAPPSNIDDAWTTLVGRLDSPRAPVHKRSRRPWLLAGAALAAAAVLLVVTIQWPSVPWAGGREYATGAGQRETVTLVDGTEVTLGPVSRLRVAKDYNGGSRRLSLEGEAYFAVVHDSTHPFRVFSGDAVTEDIGTRFVVRAYSPERTVRVVVAEGAVAFHASGVVPTTASVLRRGMAARLDSARRIVVANGIDVDQSIAWTRGELAFDRTPVREVIAELSRWYGLDIRLGDSSLSHGSITAWFRGHPLPVVLRTVAVAIGATVERDGNHVVFARVGRAARPTF